MTKSNNRNSDSSSSSTPEELIEQVELIETTEKKKAPQKVQDFDSDSEDEESLLGEKKPSLLVKTKYIFELHQHRPCRDFLFLILFLLFCGGMLVIALEAVRKRREMISLQLEKSNSNEPLMTPDMLKASVKDVLSPISDQKQVVSFMDYIIPSKREMSRFFYPTDFLGRACGVDYSNDESIESLSIASRASLFEESKIDPNFWKDDLTSKRYLWIMNEKEAFFDDKTADLLQSSDQYRKWIRNGGICVERCPGGVKTIENTKPSQTINTDHSTGDDVSAQTIETISYVSGDCPLALRQISIESTEVKEEIDVVNGNTTERKTVTKIIYKKREICGAKRAFLSKDGSKTEYAFFEVPEEQQYISLMGRCVPLPTSFPFFEKSSDLADAQKNLKLKTDFQNVASSEIMSKLLEQQKSTLSNLVKHVSTLSPASYFSATVGPYIENLPTLSNIGKEINLKSLEGLMPSFFEKFMIKSVTMLYNSWRILLISAAITVAISFVTVVTLRLFAKPLIYGTVALLIIGWFSLSIMLMVEGSGSDIHIEVNSQARWSEAFSNYISNLSWEKSIYLSSGIFLFISNLLFTTLFWFNWRKTLSRSVSIISESSKIITTVPQLFSLFPVAMFLVGGTFCVWWFCVVALMLTNELTSAGITDSAKLAEKVIGNVQGSTVSETVQNIANPTNYVFTLQSHLLKGWFAFYLLGFFWITQFLLSFVTIVVARVTSKFYFKFGNVSGTITSALRGESSAVLDNFEKTMMCLKIPVLQASVFVMFYNAGSIALASLFVGIVKYLILMIRTSLSIMGSQQDKNVTAGNRFIILQAVDLLRNNFLTRFVYRILFYILRLLEKFMEFFARNALIHCAIFGTSFFHSSISATRLMRKNATFIITLEWITDWILFCMKMLISIASVMVAYILMRSQDASIEEFSQIIGKITNAYGEQGQYGLFEMVFGGRDGLDLNHGFLLLVIVFAMSILVSSLFVTIFQSVIDTVLQCYLIDLELYRRSAGKGMGENKGRISSAEMVQIMEAEKETNYLWMEEDSGM